MSLLLPLSFFALCLPASHLLFPGDPGSVWHKAKHRGQLQTDETVSGCRRRLQARAPAGRSLHQLVSDSRNSRLRMTHAAELPPEYSFFFFFSLQDIRNNPEPDITGVVLTGGADRRHSPGCCLRVPVLVLMLHSLQIEWISRIPIHLSNGATQDDITLQNEPPGNYNIAPLTCFAYYTKGTNTPLITPKQVALTYCLRRDLCSTFVQFNSVTGHWKVLLIFNWIWQLSPPAHLWYIYLHKFISSSFFFFFTQSGTQLIM